MRQQLIEYVRNLNLSEFVLTEELPWSESDTPLYLKNPKRIYIDLEQIDPELIVETLDRRNISRDVVTVRIIFSTDAKKLPATYTDTVRQLTQARFLFNAEMELSREFDGDKMITQLVYRKNQIPMRGN